MATSEKVSFTIRRPTPDSRAASSGPDSDISFKVPSIPRHLANDTPLGSPLARSAASSPKPQAEYDSSDEDDTLQDELVTGFDRFGVQRLHKDKKEKQGPLVIAALKNKDWRELARKRRSANQYVPASAKAETGKDGSVGGLGTRDAINSGPVLSGLQVRQRAVKLETDIEQVDMKDLDEDVKMEDEETEDQKALRAILAETNGIAQDGPVIDIIPVPISETDALKQDVEELPDVATMEDYARVPVAQFGAALLRGMGWKEGTAASRKPGRGIVEPYLPAARPALLGIGAKEREVLDDGSKKKNTNTRPERRYVPIVKKEREGAGSGSGSGRERSRSPRRGSGVTSRRGSRSPDRYKDNSRPKESGRDRGYERDRDRDQRDRDRGKDRDGDRRRGESERRRDRSRESSRKRRD